MYIYISCTSTSLNVRQPWCCMQHVRKQTAYSGDLWTIFHDHPVKGSAASSAEKGHCLRPKNWRTCLVKTWKSGGFSENAWKLRLLIYFDADFTVVDDEKWTRHDLDVGPIGWIGTLVFPWFRRLGVVASGLLTRRSCVLKSRDRNVSGSCLISIRIVIPNSQVWLLTVASISWYPIDITILHSNYLPIVFIVGPFFDSWRIISRCRNCFFVLGW